MPAQVTLAGLSVEPIHHAHPPCPLWHLVPLEPSFASPSIPLRPILAPRAPSPPPPSAPSSLPPLLSMLISPSSLRIHPPTPTPAISLSSLLSISCSLFSPPLSLCVRTFVRACVFCVRACVRACMPATPLYRSNFCKRASVCIRARAPSPCPPPLRGGRGGRGGERKGKQSHTFIHSVLM